MGIFSRFKDIVSSNLNAILDHAEDPEKMVRLMIQEMEDTLIEVKSTCAADMAQTKKIERSLNEALGQSDGWEQKAKLAVSKGRDDLARAALAEKQRFAQRCSVLTEALAGTKECVSRYQHDIAELEAKLADARQKQRNIIQRHAAVTARKRAQTRIRDIDTTTAFAKFEAYENNIDRIEAEGDLVNAFRPKDPLQEQFADLEHSETVEKELGQLKAAASLKPNAKSD